MRMLLEMWVLVHDWYQIYLNCNVFEPFPFCSESRGSNLQKQNRYLCIPRFALNDRQRVNPFAQITISESDGFCGGNTSPQLFSSFHIKKKNKINITQTLYQILRIKSRLNNSDYKAFYISYVQLSVCVIRQADNRKNHLHCEMWYKPRTTISGKGKPHPGHRK